MAASGRSKRPTAAERLQNPAALLTRSDLRTLGLERRAIDGVFTVLDVVVLPGYARPMVKSSDYVELLERSTIDGRTRIR